MASEFERSETLVNGIFLSTGHQILWITLLIISGKLLSSTPSKWVSLLHFEFELCFLFDFFSETEIDHQLLRDFIINMSFELFIYNIYDPLCSLPLSLRNFSVKIHTIMKIPYHHISIWIHFSHSTIIF